MRRGASRAGAEWDALRPIEGSAIGAFGGGLAGAGLNPEDPLAGAMAGAGVGAGLGGGISAARAFGGGLREGVRSGQAAMIAEQLMRSPPQQAMAALDMLKRNQPELAAQVEDILMRQGG